jgi:hypothetical protein
MKTVLEQALEALEATLSILYEDMNMAGGPDEYAAVRTVILQTNDTIAALKEAIKAQQPEEARCKSCGGNDWSMPCAYPGEDKHGCLRDARLRLGITDEAIKQKSELNEAIAAGDGTLHGAIEYWQARAAAFEGSFNACEKRLTEAIKQQEKTALAKFKECGGQDETDPVERLRFFCSLAMKGQDWLDVEPFFDAIKQQGEPVATVMRNKAGQIFMARPDGNAFDMSKYIGQSFYTSAPSIPEGWQLVPKVVTDKSIDCGVAAFDAVMGGVWPHKGDAILAAHQAMLSAAPKEPAR